MANMNVLVTAMAQRCKEKIVKCDVPDLRLPVPLQLNHLQWMCDQIQLHADEWPATKLNRWVGFVQCAMMANGLIDLQEAKVMFNDAKIAHGPSSEDLLDHLDPASDFEVDLGGEG